MLWADRNKFTGAHLLPETKEKLKKYARLESKSMSLYISDAVETALKKSERKAEKTGITT